MVLLTNKYQYHNLMIENFVDEWVTKKRPDCVLHSNDGHNFKVCNNKFTKKFDSKVINNRFLRERGMASTPKMEYQVFLCIFQTNSALNWDSQLGRIFSLPSQRNFPISFKPKVAIAEFFWNSDWTFWESLPLQSILGQNPKLVITKQYFSLQPFAILTYKDKYGFKSEAKCYLKNNLDP